MIQPVAAIVCDDVAVRFYYSPENLFLSKFKGRTATKLLSIFSRFLFILEVLSSI